MSLKEFSKNDVFKNVLETHPRFKFKLYKGMTYVNNSIENFSFYGELLYKKVITYEQYLNESLNFVCPDGSQYIILL